MNAEQFYDEYKNCLNFLGVKWGEKELATVSVKEGWVVISYDGRQATFLVGEEAQWTKGSRNETPLRIPPLALPPRTRHRQQHRQKPRQHRQNQGRYRTVGKGT